ncbi:unnamed protein product, partial [Brenthis ino]
MNFNNKVVIVTGASSGIGAAIAVAFSSEGANVVMVGRNEARLAAVAKKCKNPLVIIGDVAEDAVIRKIIDQTIEKFGQIDVLVNNVGTAIGLGSFTDGDIIKSFDNIMRVNVRAAVFLITLATPHLMKTKGNVVNISSVVVQMGTGYPGLTNYNISKAALNHLTVCAASELGPYSIRVNTVSPGPVVTNFLEHSNIPARCEDFTQRTALNQISQPEEIADLVIFLAGPKAKSITGSCYVIDNGFLVKQSF